MNKELKLILETRKASTISQIAAAELGILELGKGLASFEIDTGEADEKVIFRSEEALQRYIDRLYLTMEWLIRRLSGRTFTSVKVRRK